MLKLYAQKKSLRSFKHTQKVLQTEKSFLETPIARESQNILQMMEEYKAIKMQILELEPEEMILNISISEKVQLPTERMLELNNNVILKNHLENNAKQLKEAIKESVAKHSEKVAVIEDMVKQTKVKRSFESSKMKSYANTHTERLKSIKKTYKETVEREILQ